MEFEETPDYKYLHALIDQIQKDQEINTSEEIVFDWVTCKVELLKQREIALENEIKAKAALVFAKKLSNK